MRLRMAFILAATLGAPSTTAAQTAPAELYRRDSEAYNRRDCVQALELLSAYAQTNAPTLRDARHASSVKQAVDFCREHFRQLERDKASLMQEIEQLEAKLGRQTASVSGIEKTPPRLEPPSSSSQPANASSSPSSVTYSGGGFPILCRGGGGMRYMLSPAGRNGIPTSSIVVVFTRAASNNVNALGPGECSWLDGPVGSQEPDQICAPVDASNIELNWTTRLVGSKGIGSFLDTLSVSDGSTKLWVENNRQGCLVVVRPAG
jgi:hypothetical protein